MTNPKPSLGQELLAGYRQAPVEIDQDQHMLADALFVAEEEEQPVVVTREGRVTGVVIPVTMPELLQGFLEANPAVAARLDAATEAVSNAQIT